MTNRRVSFGGPSKERSRWRVAHSLFDRSPLTGHREMTEESSHDA